MQSLVLISRISSTTVKSGLVALRVVSICVFVGGRAKFALRIRIYIVARPRKSEQRCKDTNLNGVRRIYSQEKICVIKARTSLLHKFFYKKRDNAVIIKRFSYINIICEILSKYHILKN